MYRITQNSILLLILSLHQNVCICNTFHQFERAWGTSRIIKISRGGDEITNAIDDTTVDEIKNDEDEDDFHDKVQKALAKLGLSSSQETVSTTEEEGTNCENGVCSMPNAEKDKASSIAIDATSEEEKLSDEELQEISKSLSTELSIPLNIVQAVVFSTRNEKQSREILHHEKTILSNISEDSDNVQALLKEGICEDLYIIRRALAFCDDDIDNARALLLAELEEEDEQEVKEEAAPVLPAISISSNIDPTKLSTPQQPSVKKEDSSTWIYNVTTSTIQSKVLESPKPVLLDIYAHWCGPCRQLTPILQEMCAKSNGVFHLAKLNSDEERTISQKCLNVQGLPTLIGINNGNIVFVQVGSPRSEQEMKEMFMKLINPSAGDIESHKELSMKLADVAGMAAIPFVQRESLQRNVQQYLTLYEEQQHKQSTSSLDVDKQILNDISFLQQVLQKVVQYPKDDKYRMIKLSHPYIKGKLYHESKKKKALFQILHLAGFSLQEDVLQLPTTVKNIAPIKIITSTLKSYIHQKGISIKNEERKRKDDLDKLELDLENEYDEYDDDKEEEGVKERKDDPNLCNVRLRIQQNKKQKPITVEHQLDPDTTTLSSIIPMILSSINHNDDDAPEIQFVCTSKKLSLSTTNPSHAPKLEKSLRELGFMPSISLVANIITTTADATDEEADGVSKEEMLKARREKQSLKRNKGSGSHTMQSVGIYSKDDNAKAELIDGGGGVWYEHDVSDDEKEEEGEEGGEEEETGKK